MTDRQRKAVEILNSLKGKKMDDGTPIISEDDYFALLSFIFEKEEETTYVPWIQPISPWQTQPYYTTPSQPTYNPFEVTCQVKK